MTELGDCDIVERGGGGGTSDHGLPAAALPNGKRVPPHRHTLQRIGEPQGILWFLSSSGFSTLFLQDFPAVFAENSAAMKQNSAT